jgi:protein gp37
MGATSIEWTDRTWNPVRGCSRVSPGCVNCYAERQASRFSKAGIRGPDAPFKGFVQITNGHPQWTGRVELVERHLEDPLHWRKPQKIFVNSMSDLYHEGLPLVALCRIYEVMQLAHWHTFQILTKRADRLHTQPIMLPNVWLGVSVEDQQRADERIPLLLRTPAAVRFVSYEPALGPVDFTPWLHGSEDHGTPLSGARTVGGCVEWTPALDWIIVGGESGPGARRFDWRWAESVQAQTQAAGVAFFMKQGGWNCWDGPDDPWHLRDRKGGDMSEWPADLRIREFPPIAWLHAMKDADESVERHLRGEVPA